MNGKFYESEYEEAFCEMLVEAGWTHRHGEELHRLITEPLLEDELRESLTERYPSLPADDVELAVARIRNVGGTSDYESLREAVELARGGFDWTPSDGTPPLHVDYIDFDNPDANRFWAVNQFEMVQRGQNRRPDVLLFVNGIPLCIVELKNPADDKATIRNAHTQITVRYRHQISSLLKYCALAVISDGAKTRLGTTVTPYEYFYAWKKVENGDDPAKPGLDEVATMVRGALAPARMLEILRDFVYFPDPAESGTKASETEIVCRYPQFFATRLLRDNILVHRRDAPGGDGKGGTYFGATGCGKTYTMLFLARQLALRCGGAMRNPTVLLIVDRDDLQTQAAKLFCRSKRFLCDDGIRVFDSRDDLCREMTERKGGGFYVTTIQKFSESTGLLTDRANVVCMSDEAHRTQNNAGSKLKIVFGGERRRKREEGGHPTSDDHGRLLPPVPDWREDEKSGAFVSYGFAKYLRDALPNATYVGFTGTPIDETVYVFGDIVDSYTMSQAVADGITVPIQYDPRLARVLLDKDQAAKIEEYYRQCADEGATEQDVEASKRAMSAMEVILGDPQRLALVAADIVQDWETRLADKPDLPQRAMVCCASRDIAFRLWRTIGELRPAWLESRKALDESGLTAEELDKLDAVPYVNLVATRGKDDPAEMWDAFGDDDHRKSLDGFFKREESNFRIAIVVDMWITGFDVPSLTVLYNDKPLQKHTLIQTISRVNRRWREKECGVIVDYIGIRENMKEAMKKYGGGVTPPADVETAHEALRDRLSALRELCQQLDFTPFFGTNALKRLLFLQTAAEFVMAQSGTAGKKGEVPFDKVFGGHVRVLRAAYDICNPAGVLADDEAAWSQCFMGIQSFLQKLGGGQVDTESMNRAVEQMVREALTSTGVETVLGSEGKPQDIYGAEFIKELEGVKLPCTKFQILAKLLRKAIRDYGKTNRIRAKAFEEMLDETVRAYNTRDRLVFASSVASDTVNAIANVVEASVKPFTEQLLELLAKLRKDREEFRALGISFEEKAFRDILVDVRDRHGFEYDDERCTTLAGKIKALVDGTAVYADWLNNMNVRAKLASDLTFLLYENGYPPDWSNDIFAKVLEQVENYKGNAGSSESTDSFAVTNTQDEYDYRALIADESDSAP